MKTTKYLILSFLLVMSFLAHGQSDKPRFNVGSLRNATYTNSYFSLKLRIPKAWQALDEQGKKRLEDEGVQAVSNDISPQASKNAERSLKTTTFNLLTLFRPDGPTFIVLAEKVGATVVDSSIYLNHMRDLYKMDKSVMSVGDVKSEFVNGRTFSTLSATLREGKFNIQQKTYAVIDKEYALSFVLTYVTEAQQKDISMLLESIEFQ